MGERLYYKAVCRRYPTLITAQSLKMGSYVFDFSPKRYAWCEVGFIQKGRIREYREEQEWIHEEGCIYTFAAPAALRHYSEDPEHVEVILRIRIQEWQPVTREEVLNWQPKPGEFLLTNQLTDPVLCGQLEPLIKNAVGIYNGHSANRETRTMSILLDIFARIGDHIIREAAASPPEIPAYDAEYCRRACAYVQAHLSEKLSAEEVAGSTGISYSRLSRVFRTAMGMTLVEYIHRQRLLLAEKLILRDGLQQEEAAVRAGFCNSKYMQRLFRRYHGVTFTQYRALEVGADQAQP